MPKLKVTNLELISIAGEYHNFNQMFPYISRHLGTHRFIEKNKPALDALNAGQHKLLTDHVVFENDQPVLETVEKKIIDIGGKLQEQPVQDWRFKSESDKETFKKLEEELQKQIAEIVL